MINWELTLRILEGFSYVGTFIGTFGLLIVAIIGLSQIKISKQAANMTAKRDSIRSANEQVKFYTSEIIPYLNDLYDYEMKNKITIFKESEFSIDNNNIEAIIKPRGADGSRQFNLIIDDTLKVLNCLETLSSVITSGLANEEVVFKAIGSSYCYSVKKMMPFIVVLGRDDAFQNIIELYINWSNKAEKQSLEKQREIIDKSLRQKGDGKKIIQLDKID